MNKIIVEQKEYNNDNHNDFNISKDDIIICANCNKQLLSVIKVKEDKNIQTAIRVQCPFCKDTSFWYKISGKIYIQSVEGLSITDMPVDIRNGIMFTNIKVKKNE